MQWWHLSQSDCLVCLFPKLGGSLLRCCIALVTNISNGTDAPLSGAQVLQHERCHRLTSSSCMHHLYTNEHHEQWWHLLMKCLQVHPWATRLTFLLLIVLYCRWWLRQHWQWRAATPTLDFQPASGTMQTRLTMACRCFPQQHRQCCRRSPVNCCISWPRFSRITRLVQVISMDSNARLAVRCMQVHPWAAWAMTVCWQC